MSREKTPTLVAFELARLVYESFDGNVDDVSTGVLMQKIRDETPEVIDDLLLEYCRNQLGRVRCEERSKAKKHLHQPRVFSKESQIRVAAGELKIMPFWEQFRLQDGTMLKNATLANVLANRDSFHRKGFGTVHSGDILDVVARKMLAKRAKETSVVSDVLSEEQVTELVKSVRRRDETE